MLMTPSIKCLLANLAGRKKSLILFPGYSRCKKNLIHNPLWQRGIMNQVLLEK